MNQGWKLFAVGSAVVAMSRLFGKWADPLMPAKISGGNFSKALLL